MPSSRCPHTASTQLSRSSHITATRSHTALTKFPRTKPPCSHHIAPHSNDSSNQLSHSPHTVPTNAASMQSPYRSNTAVKLQQRRCTQPSRSLLHAALTPPSRRPHAAQRLQRRPHAAEDSRHAALTQPSRRCTLLLTAPPTHPGGGRASSGPDLCTGWSNSLLRILARAASGRHWHCEAQRTCCSTASTVT